MREKERKPGKQKVLAFWVLLSSGTKSIIGALVTNFPLFPTNFPSVTNFNPLKEEVVQK